MDTLRAFGPNRVVWLNVTESGNETAWDELIPLFPPITGARQVADVAVDILQVQCSSS